MAMWCITVSQGSVLLTHPSICFPLWVRLYSRMPKHNPQSWVCLPLFVIVVAFFFFFYFQAAPWHMEFQDQRADPSCSLDLLCSCTTAVATRSCQNLNPLCQTGDFTCIPMLQGHIQSHCATAGTPIYLYFKQLWFGGIRRRLLS